MKLKNHPSSSKTGFVSILIIFSILTALVPPTQADTIHPAPVMPVQASPPPPPDGGPERSSLVADPLVITQVADTDSGIPGIVYNGGTVTYTLSLQNTGATTLNDILVKDFLPREGETVYYLQDVNCTTPAYSCSLIDNTYTIPLPSGNTVAVTATREISWAISSLAPDALVELQFSGMVLGQPDGTTFTNNAEATYGGSVVRSDPLTLMVEVLIDVSGEAAVSDVPTWFSQDVGGTISQDWGDFDRDGQLDLALGSSVGVSVYRNDGGTLSEVSLALNLRETHRQAYGVRWADVIPDSEGCLELVVVGDSVDETSTGIGTNYIYHYNGDSFVEEGQFNSEYQLVRLEPGDFDGDGDVDLIGSTNAINADCNVILYFNDGAGNFTTGSCLSLYATAAIAAADYDHDSDLDLAIGAFPGTIQILQNERAGTTGPVAPNTNYFNIGEPILLESFLEYLPYDIAWGDYDQDTDLDLAAAYPIQREVHIYENQGGTDILPFQLLSTGPFMTPLALDWGDFNGDGRIELAVADSPPIFYSYDDAESTFKEWPVDLPINNGQVWSMRGVDLNNQSNLDLVMTNRDGPSQIFPAFSPNLENDLTPVTSSDWGAGSTAWGDIDDDGDFDLLFGSSTAPNSSSFLYENQEGTFPSRQGLADGFGPHTVAFGNIMIDDSLDIAIGTPAALLVYRDGILSSPIDVPSDEPILSLAWADPDDDSQSELLVGTAEDDDGLGQITLLQFDGTTATPSFTTTVSGDVRSLAWADVDGDYYLDFAVGIDGAPAQIYRSTGDGYFSLLWQSSSSMTTRAIAWADVDADGDLDLAAGQYNAQDVVWENDGGTFLAFPIGPSDSKTTSLAWGDWNNDGYPDLATGIDGGQDIVYANIASEPGALRLSPLWNSAESAATTGVAWGDADGDGDLDLAVSRKNNAQSGFYENTMWPAAHLSGANTLNDPALPNTPVYVSVDRPSSSPPAYFYSAPELVTGPNHPTVTVAYRLFDPEEVPVSETLFEYSLDGGNVWLQATPSISATLPTNETSRSGALHTFVWDARADVAISDNARFRVRVFHQDTVGNSQRATSIGVSPPFRVRSLDCYWPVGATITSSNNHPEIGEEIILTATLDYGSGQLNATWDLADGTIKTGWIITHTFDRHLTADVILRVDGPACPIARPAFARLDITVGLGTLPPRAYLPLVISGQTPSRDAIPSTPTNTPSPETQIPTPSAASPLRQSTPLPPMLWSEDPIRSISAATADTASSSSDLIQVNRNQIGFQSQPAVNDDGHYIAFWSTGDFDTTGNNSNPDGNIEIFLAHVASTRDIAYTQVTSSTGSILGGFNLYPDIDNDGNTLVFFSDGDLIAGQNPDLNFEIFLAEIRPAGSPLLTQVTHTSQGVNILPSISGDGNRIAFVSNQNLSGDNSDGNQEIHIALIENTGQVSDTIQITNSNGCFNDRPSLSNNGRFIAYVSNCDLVGQNSDLGFEIFLTKLDANGTPLSTIQVTNSSNGTNDLPSINGDGSRIAFVSTDDTATPAQVYLAQIDTGGPLVSTITQLTDDSSRKTQPDISTDGRRLAFISVESPTVRRLSLYDVDNRNTVRLNTGDENLHPTLSQDGRRLAYVANWDIFLANPPDIDLTLAKTASPNTVDAGDSLYYGLKLTNNSTETASGIVVSDTLPFGVIAELPHEPADYVDDDGLLNGFGGGTFDGTNWDTTIGALTMDDPSSGVVTFTSRIMASGPGAHGWNSIALYPTRPIAMPLPDNNDFESGYSEGNVDMASNILLLHLDELETSQTFIDTSGQNHHMSCRSPNDPYSCPTSGSTGVLGKAIFLRGDYNQSIVLDNTDPETDTDLVLGDDFTIAMWVLPLPLYYSRQVFISKHIYNASTDRDVIHFGIENEAYRFRMGSINYVDPAATAQWWEWQHVVAVGRANDAGTETEVTLYRNGEELWTHVFGTTAGDDADGIWAIGNDFDGAYQPDDFFTGAIDEVAVLNRAVSAQEVQDIYLRGALQARFQVQACNDSDCNGETFVGPNGSGSTYYPAVTDYDQNFEYNDGGYTHGGTQDEWEWGTPTAWPEGCVSGTGCWGTDLDGDYENYANQVLYSPLIDLSNIRPGSVATLNWWQALEIEWANYDHARAEVSFNGGAWTPMWEHTAGSGVQNWERKSYNVSLGIGGYIQLRWILETDVSVRYSGYYIDDVSITVIPPPNLFEADYLGQYPPTFLLNLPTDQPYFQYRVLLNSYDDAESPAIEAISVNPRVNCGGTEAVNCYVDPDAALLGGASLIWEIPTLVTADAYQEATPRGNELIITNTASVEGVGFELTPGDNTATAETILETSRLGDRVWEDLDGDGRQETGEPGIGGVVVRLYDSKDNNIFTTTTDVNGLYNFVNLPSGNFYLEFTPPQGFAFTIQDAGNDDTIDSDADQSGLTDIFTLSTGDIDLDWDAGLYQPATLGDFVWEDLDADGIQESGEPGIGGVTVALHDNQGNSIDTTTTASDGTYHFYDVSPGRYTICFTPSVTYTFTIQDAGSDDTLDSDADPATGCTAAFNLNSGTTRNRWDAGLYRPVSLGDFVWEDLDADGIQDPNEPGIAGATVRLYDDGGTQLDITTTTGGGAYAFTDLPPGIYQIGFDTPAGYRVSPIDQGSDDTLDSDGSQTPLIPLLSGDAESFWDAGFYQLASLGGRVWGESDDDGIREPGEPAVAGVTVNLYDSEDTLVLTTTTASDGSYRFTDLVPFTYYLEFVAPSGYLFTQRDAGSNENLDSDARTSDGLTALLTLTSGEDDTSWGAGFRLASLGDRAWVDNGNGIQEVGEVGLSGVTVELYDSASNLVALTSTNSSGIYYFHNIFPGDYFLRFTAPTSYTFTLANAGDDALDSDANATGYTITINLTSGEDDDTWDAGFTATSRSSSGLIEKVPRVAALPAWFGPGLKGKTVSPFSGQEAPLKRMA